MFTEVHAEDFDLAAWRSTWSGQSLGTEITDEQLKEINSGALTTIGLGDYWTLDCSLTSGQSTVVFRVADYDYYYSIGYSTKHDLILIPDTVLGGSRFSMDSSRSNAKGYYNSAGRLMLQSTIKNGLPEVIQANLWTHIMPMSTSTSSGSKYPNTFEVLESNGIELMSSKQVFGDTTNLTKAAGGSNVSSDNYGYADPDTGNAQFAVFKFDYSGNAVTPGTDAVRTNTNNWGASTGSNQSWWLSSTMKDVRYAEVNSYTSVINYSYAALYNNNAGNLSWLRPAITITKVDPVTITYTDGSDASTWDGESQLEITKDCTITVNKSFSTGNSIKINGSNLTVTIDGKNKTLTETGDYFLEVNGSSNNINVNDISVTSSKSDTNQNGLFSIFQGATTYDNNTVTLNIGTNNTIKADRIVAFQSSGNKLVINSGNYQYAGTVTNVAMLDAKDITINGGTFTGVTAGTFLNNSNHGSYTMDNCTISGFNTPIVVAKGTESVADTTFVFGSNITFTNNSNADIAFEDGTGSTVKFIKGSSSKTNQEIQVSYANSGSLKYGDKTYFTSSETEDMSGIYSLTSTVSYISIAKDDTGYYLYKDPTKTNLQYSTKDNAIQAKDDSSVVGEENVETLTLSFTASNADYTGSAYSSIATSGNLLSLTGETPTYTYVGINGTEYDSSSSAPIKLGEYQVTLTLHDQTITNTFKITEPESFTKAKSKALTDLDTLITNAKQSISDIVDLTDAEKKSYQDRIDAAKPTIKAAIEAVTLDGTQTLEQAIASITQTLTNGQSTINGIVSEAQAAAKAKVDSARATAKETLANTLTVDKAAIDALDTLTEEEKTAYKDQLDTKLSEINTSLDACNTVADVNTTKTNGDNALSAIVNDATLANTKKAKKAELDTYAQSKNNEVNDLTGLTEEEKTAYESQINKELNDAKDEIDKATSSDGFDTLVSNAKKDMDTIASDASNASDLANKKTEKKTELDTKAQETIDSINAFNDLSDSQKKNYIDQVNKEVEEAKSNIDSAKTIKDVENITTETEKSFDDIVTTATSENTLEANRKAKKTELDEYAQNEKDKVNALTGLTEEEKKAYESKIDEEVEKSKTEIDKATAAKDLDDIISETKKDIESIEKDATGASDLANAKTDKKNELDTKTQEKINEVNSSDSLTDVQKKAIEEVIKKEFDETKSNIDSAKTIDEVNKIAKEASTALDETSSRVEAAKKYMDTYFHDSTSITKDNYKKVLESKEAYDALEDNVKKLVNAMLKEQFGNSYENLYKEAESIDKQITEEKKKASTDTGDNTQIFLYSTMLMLSIAGLGILLSLRRKLTH